MTEKTFGENKIEGSESLELYSHDEVNKCFEECFEELEDTEYEESLINLQNAYNYNTTSLQTLKYQELLLQDKNEKLKSKVDYKLSYSKQTFPHQLMRVVLLESIYRSATISNNITYHK